MQFSNKLSKIKPSPTLALNARAKKMQAEGVSVVNFTCGEPDFDTPKHISNAAISAIYDGFTKYTPICGITELQDSIIRAIKKEQGLEYKRNEIIVTPGAKYAIYTALQAMLNDGDEVLIIAPYWVSYPDQALLCSAKPVLIQTSESTRFKITPKALEDAITDKTRVLILNSPSNPTGSAYTKEELKEIANICIKHDTVVISDEIYDGIVFDGFKCTSIATFDGMKERTVIINGVSKRFAMTGWRMGFAAGPAPLISKMSDIQGQAVTSVTSITQKACVAAYDGPAEPIQKMVGAFCERRNHMVERLNKMGLKCTLPEGAFYAFPNVTSLYGKKIGDFKIKTSADVSEAFLVNAHVATVPGEAFGLSGHIRLSFATSMENIKKGLARIEKAISNI